jgi:hypothetical protein
MVRFFLYRLIEGYLTMKLLCLVQAFAISGAVLLSGLSAAIADEDCCAGTPACEAMKKSKAEGKSNKEEVKKVSSETTVESKVDEKAPSAATEKSGKSI